ncbi:hypothetical protein [Streptomyces cyslabdanicus]|uniref:hypothetical protein n=1 Tax=Streptomyces cyslabdanicus TaxID=1470456 RepID=UPI004043F046
MAATATALTVVFLTVGCDVEVFCAVHGQELTRVPGDWLSLGVSWIGLVAGCARAGVLAAGVFRSTTAGLATVPAVVQLIAQPVGGALALKLPRRCARSC